MVAELRAEGSLPKVSTTVEKLAVATAFLRYMQSGAMVKARNCVLSFALLQQLASVKRTRPRLLSPKRSAYPI